MELSFTAGVTIGDALTCREGLAYDAPIPVDPDAPPPELSSLLRRLSCMAVRRPISRAYCRIFIVSSDTVEPESFEGKEEGSFAEDRLRRWLLELDSAFMAALACAALRTAGLIGDLLPDLSLMREALRFAF